MFGDAAPDTDQQLLAEEGQWIFTVEGEKYYLSSSRQHFSLLYYQSVTAPRKMKLSVTQFTDSVHVEILTLHSYNHCGSPKAVLGMHLQRIRQDLPVGETWRWRKLS